MTDILQKLHQVHDQIAAALAAADRAAGSCRLLAVSKTRSADDIRAAVAAGQTCLGENYVQEGVAKVKALAGLGIEWHFIGPVQANKTRDIAAYFDWVHSVDRAKIAVRLNAQRPAGLPPLNVCVQVNISGEASKSGVPVGEVEALCAAIGAQPALALRGLMALPAPAQDHAAQRVPFRQLHELATTLADKGYVMDTLSMGMTNDLEAAILEGSTLVRVGTGIFGPRR